MNSARSILFSNRSLATRCLSAPADGSKGCVDSVHGPTLSEDGRYVAANCVGHELLGEKARAYKNSLRLDTARGTFEMVRTDDKCTGNDDNLSPAISGDGQHVAFCTWHQRPDPTGAVGSHRDVFVRDYLTGQTDLCTDTMDGAEPLGDALAPALSRDGRVVVFEAQKRGLEANPSSPGSDLYAYDRVSHVMSPVAVSSTGNRANARSSDPTVSGDGRLVAFASHASNLVAGDANEVMDVFVHDRQSGTTQRVSVTSTGLEANGESFAPSISADGHFVAFGTHAKNLGGSEEQSALCIHDMQTGRTEKLNTPGGLNLSFLAPALSGDGNFVAFVATPAGSDKNNVYVHDRSHHTTACVSKNAAGENADSSCRGPAISADGRVVAYSTDAGNLVPNPVKTWSDQLYISMNPLHPTVLRETLERLPAEQPPIGTVDDEGEQVIINGLVLHPYCLPHRIEIKL